MADIDPVIFEFQARVSGYIADLKRTTSAVDQAATRQEARIRKLETEMRRSSGAISSQLRGLAGTLATYFTGRELVGLIDGFTRFQNNLRVAGLEGDKLVAVQERLFGVAQRYGVELEGLSKLYSRGANSQKELGASSGDLIKLTEAVAASLKVLPADAGAVNGALTQLGQALASPRVQAEEFNSIMDVFTPLMQEAAKHIDGTGGSLAGLRNKLKDVKGPGVSNIELFRAIVAALDEMEKKASKTSLTLGGAFTNLTNALTKYVGEAGQANGATAAVTQAIVTLSKNFDTVLNALAVIGSVLAGRYVAGMLAGAAATGVASAAVFAFQARMAGAATTAQALAFAGTAAGRSLLAAFGGPVGLAVTGLVLGIGYLAASTEEASQTAAEHEKMLKRQGDAAQYGAKMSDYLRRATEEERKATIAAMKAARAKAQQDILAAKAALQRARAELTLAKSRIVSTGATAAAAAGAPVPGLDRTIIRGQMSTNPRIGELQGATQSLASSIDSMTASVEKFDAAIGAAESYSAPTPSAAPASSAARATGSKGGAGPSGPTAAEIARRHADEMSRLQQEELRAQADLATDAGQRSDLLKDLLAVERAERVRQIENDETFTREQKRAQIDAINRLYGKPSVQDAAGNTIIVGKPGLIAQGINRETERQLAELARSSLEAQRATLEAQTEMETNLTKRNAIERRLLDVQQKIERDRNEEQIATGQIAASTRDELDAQQKLARLKLDRAQRTPGQVYRDGIRDAADNINEGVEAIQVKGLEALNDGIVEAIMNSRDLGDVFKSVANQIIGDLLRIAIQQTVIKPLADSLFSNKPGGGGGAFGAVASGIGALFGAFGKAGGGPVAPGQFYRVNENATPGRVEGFMSRDGGQIIPLGQMDALRAGGGQAGGEIMVRVSLTDDLNARIDNRATGVAIEVTRQAAPTIIEAAKNTTLAAASRQRL